MFESTTRVCQWCGELFPVQSGPQKFCSASCRGKNRYSKPEEKQKSKTYQTKWRAKNHDKNKAYHRVFYRRNKLQKLKLHPWLSLLRGRKSFAKQNNIIFDLDLEWAEKRWTGKCELTGIDFAPPERRVGYKNRNLSPSIDRIVPNKGYTKDNCRFIIWAVNAFKRDGDEEEMFAIAAALLRNKGYIIITP